MSDFGPQKTRPRANFDNTTLAPTGPAASVVPQTPTGTPADWQVDLDDSQLSTKHTSGNQWDFILKNGACVQEAPAETSARAEDPLLEPEWSGQMAWSEQEECQEMDMEALLEEIERNSNSCQSEDFFEFDESNNQALSTPQSLEQGFPDQQSTWHSEDNLAIPEALPLDEPWPDGAFCLPRVMSSIEWKSSKTSKREKVRSILNRTTRQFSNLWCQSPGSNTARSPTAEPRGREDDVISCSAVRRNSPGSYIAGEPEHETNGDLCACTLCSPPRRSRPNSPRFEASIDLTASLHSWQSDDHHLLSPFKNWIDKLDTGGSCLFISSELPYRNRMEMHAVANTNGLSHMSVGTGENKRLIATPFRIDPHPGNGTRRGWKLGWDSKPLRVDPKHICLHVPRSKETAYYPIVLEVETMLKSLLVPQWEHIRRPQIEKSEDSMIFVVTYTNAGDALRALKTLDGNLDPSLGRIRADYPILKGDVYIATTTEPFNDVQDQCTTIKTILLPSRFFPTQGSPRESSHRNSVSRQSFSSSSGISSDQGSHYSAESSASKKRKRSEKIENGYECDVCRKVWSLASDRDKHWRNVHGRKTHTCPVCDKAFAYAKDVQRHLSVHTKD